MPRTCDPTPTAALPRWLAALGGLVAMLLLAACGGSGSSGFDVAAENRAIDRVVMTEVCETVDGLRICSSSGPLLPSPTPTEVKRTATPTPPIALPTDTATPFPMPSGSATPTGTPRPPTETATRAPTHTPTMTSIPMAPSVDIDAAPSDGCPPTSDAACVFVLSFAPRDVPPDAAYRVALRGRDPDTAWTIFPATANSAVVEIPIDVSQYQVAVLVFLDPPGFVPEKVERLSTTGADFAFVTPVESRPE